MKKPPISYYGGKQRLVSTILPLFPAHVLYNEPFAGGLALLFGKERSEVEVVNDTNTELINFYKVMKQDFVSLQKQVAITLHSRKQHEHTRVIYAFPELFSELQRAWAVWVLATQSFASSLTTTWGFDLNRNTHGKKIVNKTIAFDESYAVRLQNVQIECADALYVIRSRDHENAFHYCDPPYYNSDCRHYGGYTLDDYTRLLETLAGVKGKFLLSSYPSEVLDKFVSEHGWYQIRINQTVSVCAKSGIKKPKVEVLTANYPLEGLE